MQTKSTTTPLQRLDMLNNRFSVVTRLMNTAQTLLIAGGGVMLRVQSDSPYYERFKALLSDIGCDIAAEKLMVFELIDSNNSGSLSG